MKNMTKKQIESINMRKERNNRKKQEDKNWKEHLKYCKANNLNPANCEKWN